MLLVLIVHADFYSLHLPTDECIIQYPVSSWTRYTIQSLSIICVNVYIIISGYFGIKIKAKSIANFLFMIIFWRIFITLTYLIYKYYTTSIFALSLKKIILLCIPGWDDWFVCAYILLMCFAPILNDYIKNSNPKRLASFIIFFYFIQTVFSWGIPMFHIFGNGYSTISFLGLYICGAFIHKVSLFNTKNFSFYFNLYVLISIIYASLLFYSRFCSDTTPFNGIISRAYMYNAPIVIFTSLMFFLAFSRLRLHSLIVNKIALSAFAVYLAHMHPLVRPYYARICSFLFDNFNTIPYIIFISAFILGIFLIVVLFDQLRIHLWNWLYNKYINSKRLIKLKNFIKLNN